MLIPEIALTYQTVQRFTARFGDRVSVMNSTLSAGENRISAGGQSEESWMLSSVQGRHCLCRFQTSG